MTARASAPAANAICPYFTMFPYAFPESVLRALPRKGSIVLDPFCGRGTTNLASRCGGFPTIGIDSNPVAVAIAQAKLVQSDPEWIVNCAIEILRSLGEPTDVPHGDFWDLAFAPDVLDQLCRLRESLLEDCATPARIALRAIVLGALHGPRNKGNPSYFSNQSPRTYAPKPDYAVRFWRDRGLEPQLVDVVEVIFRRAHRYYGEQLPTVAGKIILGDSRVGSVFADIEPNVGLIVTSPPYYGMRTYIPDQWLRWWFLGGPDTVDYSNGGQLGHSSPTAFAAELGSVWRNVASIARPDARLVIRFGAINDRKVDPQEIVKESLQGTGWHIQSIEPAGTAAEGRRQANHFVRRVGSALEEYDVLARLT